jgi:hypothetical protein
MIFCSLRTDLRVEANIVLGRTPEGFVRFDALSGDIFFDTLQVRKLHRGWFYNCFHRTHICLHHYIIPFSFVNNGNLTCHLNNF